MRLVSQQWNDLQYSKYILLPKSLYLMRYTSFYYLAVDLIKSFVYG